MQCRDSWYIHQVVLDYIAANQATQKYFSAALEQCKMIEFYIDSCSNRILVYLQVNWIASIGFKIILRACSMNHDKFTLYLKSLLNKNISSHWNFWSDSSIINRIESNWPTTDPSRRKSISNGLIVEQWYILKLAKRATVRVTSGSIIGIADFANRTSQYRIFDEYLRFQGLISSSLGCYFSDIIYKLVIYDIGYDRHDYKRWDFPTR